MTDEEQAELDAENQANGGETVDNKTTATKEDAEKDYKKIADDQRKRAEIAEAKLKAEKPKEKAEEPKSTNNDYLSREEGILIAQGMDADDLEELKSVAQAKKLSLLKAKDTPLFQAYIEKRESDRKKEKAKIGASKGSQASQEKSVSELTNDEHREFFKETMSKVS